MSDREELWQTIVDRVRSVPAMASVKRPSAKSTVAAALGMSELPSRSDGGPVLVTAQDSVTEIEINIEVLADVSASATALAAGAAIDAVLDEHGADGRHVVVRVLSIRR